MEFSSIKPTKNGHYGTIFGYFYNKHDNMAAKLTMWDRSEALEKRAKKITINY